MEEIFYRHVHSNVHCLLGEHPFSKPALHQALEPEGAVQAMTEKAPGFSSNGIACKLKFWQEEARACLPDKYCTSINSLPGVISVLQHVH